MDDNAIKKKCREFLGKYIRNKEIKDDDDIFANGFVNSLFAMQLVLFVEKTFSVKVENEDLDINNFNSLNSLLKYVNKKV